VILLLDFGASRVKAGVWDGHSIIATTDGPAPAPDCGADGAVTVDPAAYPLALSARLAELATLGHTQFSVIWLCSEMHGGLIVDDAGGPLTPYLSWRDGRTAGAHIDADRFRTLTGMKLRPGLPVMTLGHLQHTGHVPRGRFVSLPEWLVIAMGHACGVVHTSMAAASGFYDLTAADWSAELMTHAPGVCFAAVADTCATPMGTLPLNGRDVPVFGGVGDLQATALGAGLGTGFDGCLNLGTGSQVLSLGAKAIPPVELRPGAAGGMLRALTHMPSGRALALCAAAHPAFWAEARVLNTDQILNATTQKIDLNLFPSGWKYRQDIPDIQKQIEILNPADITPAILHAYAAQYAEAMDLIDPDRTVPAWVLAGGVPHHIPALAKTIGMLSRRTITPSGTTEETLAGLARLMTLSQREREGPIPRSLGEGRMGG
jgi:sugar (pentulose or hexulose) kinase